MSVQPHRRTLDGEYFDILVIGGGINGVAIARECAQAGKRVLLAEAHDFGAGTTSRSTRIIHGGLRYLEYGEIGLVRESLRERRRLLVERGHLVRPRTFLLALPRPGNWRHNALTLRFGLWLYQRLAGVNSKPSEPTDDLTLLERHLDAGQNWSVFSYEDAQCEFPELLVAEWLADTVAFRAVARNYTEVLQVTKAHGHVTGAVMRDRLSNAEFKVTAPWVVNATGPWADRICATSSIGTETPLVGGVRGTHIVLAPWPGMPDAAVYTEAHDGRPIFLVPWNRDVLVGTTEVSDDSDPGNVQPSPDEIQYLLRCVQRLFPSMQSSKPELKLAFAGIRPLPFSPGKSASAITRKHVLHDHSADGVAGMISVVGGKLTTAAALARKCARLIGLQVHEAHLEIVPPTALNRVEGALGEWSSMVSTATGLEEDAARSIAQWHGERSSSMCELASKSAPLRAPLCPHSCHVVAEAVSAVQTTCAVTLADILLRRVPVALSSHWSSECTCHAAEAIAPVLGWPTAVTRTEIERFEDERARFLCKPEDTSNEPLLTTSGTKRAA